MTETDIDDQLPILAEIHRRADIELSIRLGTVRQHLAATVACIDRLAAEHELTLPVDHRAEAAEAIRGETTAALLSMASDCHPWLAHEAHAELRRRGFSAVHIAAHVGDINDDVTPEVPA